MAYGEKYIEFMIDTETGEVTIEAMNFTGGECKKATEPFERALGTVTDRTSKPEMWNTGGTTGQQNISKGW